MTGHVSPQYHVRVDPTFQMIKKLFYGDVLLSSWQELCGFCPLTKRKQPSEGASASQEQPRPHTRLQPPPAPNIATASEGDTNNSRIRWADQQQAEQTTAPDEEGL
jgi:hypothetical protein